MTWFTVIVILIIAVVATIAFSAMAFLSGFIYANKRVDGYVKKLADRMVDDMLKEKIGKTLAGVTTARNTRGRFILTMTERTSATPRGLELMRICQTS